MHVSMHAPAWLHAACMAIHAVYSSSFHPTIFYNYNTTIIIKYFLAGQFWNIPIQVIPFNITKSLFAVTVRYPDSKPRSFIGDLSSLSWERRDEYCLYVGSRQGGPLNPDDAMGGPNDPVIEGEYLQYKVDSSFASEFTYSHFDETRCS